MKQKRPINQTIKILVDGEGTGGTCSGFLAWVSLVSKLVEGMESDEDKEREALECAARVREIAEGLDRKRRELIKDEP